MAVGVGLTWDNVVYEATFSSGERTPTAECHTGLRLLPPTYPHVFHPCG